MRRLLLLALLLPAGAAAAEPPPQDRLVISPAHGWILPLFTPEGYRSIILRGDEAQVRQSRIDVKDVDITLFSGTAANTITTIILSPEGTYFPRDNVASGPAAVRVIYTADNAELTGEDWTYAFRRATRGGARETLTIRRNARVELQEPLHDFLQ